MAITRKPRKTSPASSVSIDNLINKGGGVALPTDTREKKAEKQMSLRVPGTMLEKIDRLLDQKVIRMPRHTWVLEAIEEKLAREEKKN